MALDIDTAPSAQARHLYSMMVARADDKGDGDMVLSLAHSIELTCVLSRRQTQDEAVCSAVAELRQAQWIAPEPAGGWRIS